VTVVVKRVLDICLSFVGLVTLSPLLAVVAILIRLDSPGPVFFRQERVGRHGVTFRIFKFRTMTQSPQAGPQLTVAGDSRITRIGRFLRHYKIDELPQLIDVLRGTMSLVGPRPEVPKYVEHYPEHERSRILSVRPGITDLASLKFRHENDILAKAANPELEYIDVILPSKLRYAMHYVDSTSIGHDMRVLGLTLRTVFVPNLTSPWGVAFMRNSNLWIALDRKMSALKPNHRILATLVDGLIVLACWHTTYLFRLGFERWQPGRPPYDDWVSLGVVLAYLVCLELTGARRGLWRFVGFDEFKRIALACLIAGSLSATVVLMARLVGVARAVLLLHPLFCMAALGMARMLFRVTWEHARYRASGVEGEPRRAIVLGAGEAARRLIAGIHRRDGWVILALLDDDPAKQGIRVSGIPVVGPLSDLLMLHLRSAATHVIIAMPGAASQERAKAGLLAKETGLPVLTIPSESELQEENLPAGLA